MTRPNLRSRIDNRTFNSTIASCVVVAFALLFGLCLLFPYTGDDWAWGSSIGIERLQLGFADYNGRYLGNIIVLALTRSLVLRSLVVAACLASIPLLICMIAERVDAPTYCMSLTIILLMPAGEAAQTVAWASGFTNYAIPTVALLAYLNASKRELFSKTRPSESLKRIAGMLALGLTSSLIMETITLFNLCASFASIAFIRIWHGRWSRSQLAFLVGAAIGASVMFSNGAYWAVAAGENAYQSVSALNVSDRLLSVFPYWLSTYNWAIYLFPSIAFLYWIGSDNRQSPMTITCLTMLLAVLALSVYASFLSSEGGRHRLLDPASGIALMITVLLVIAFGLRFRGSRRATLTLLALLCICILAVPLLIVNPIGPRNFLTPYVLECLIACLVWAELVDAVPRLASLLLAAVLAAVMAQWVIVYWPVHKSDVERNEAIAQAAAAGKSSATVEKLPAEGHIHCPDPTDGLWEHRYKLFYGIPDDFDIVLK